MEGGAIDFAPCAFNRDMKSPFGNININTSACLWCERLACVPKEWGAVICAKDEVYAPLIQLSVNAIIKFWGQKVLLLHNKRLKCSFFTIHTSVVPVV